MTARDKDGGKPERVSPQLYTREYYTTDCEGYDLFLQGVGELPERIEESLEAAGDLRGKWVLDIGCGRGELTCEAARRGAYAVGIDYAEAALDLSRERLSGMDESLRRRVQFLLADAKGLAFPDGSFDVVFLVDVYEHLYPREIAHTLAETKRVLRPGGVLVVHTGPNTWFYCFGYPFIRTAARLFLRKELPHDLRGQYDDIMHVNEQNPLSLYRALKSTGYHASVLPRSFLTGMNPSGWQRLLMRLLFTRPWGYVFCTSLLAEARPWEGGREPQLRVNRMLRMMAPGRDSRILLLGEVEGMLAQRLSDLVDVDVTWLEPGGAEGEEEAAPSLRAYNFARLFGDAARLPFPDEHLDAIAAQFTLDYVEDPQAVLEECFRVLKRNGVLTLVVKNRLFHGWEPRPRPSPLQSFSPRELEQLAGRCGFQVTETSTLIPDVKLPAFYRGDLDFCLKMERLPYYSSRGKLLFLKAVKETRGC
ncbi:MAG: methyltransferase domain-containing protein [Actinomycetota bacterium]|nr:methyltransferase domain-containing protein [Actinomycetota bacterium]